ncbi:MAG: hypothetical protein CMO80_15995 [Verrucomicrobiales bacterium]|nr:hypothetical protein [Verrucomicrobiales bacterium]|tara:strand:+ start:132 stop:1751 length:1620 start_codon:yes stop_codon:yes gene_type:complete
MPAEQTDAQPAVNPRKRWMRVGLVMFSSIASLALCELIVRFARLAPPAKGIWLDDPESFYVPSSNPILGHEIKSSFQSSFPSGDASSNEHGLRDPDRPIAKPAEVRRILLLGDSVVEGIAHVADDDTISRSLERLYEDGTTEVFNFGTSGYCTMGEVELLEEKGLRLSPDVVVLVFVNNDFQNFNSEQTLAARIDRPEAVKHLFLASDFFRFCSLRLNWFGFADEANPLQFNTAAIGENNVVEGMARLKELALRYRFKVLVAVWPTFNNDGIIDAPIMPGTADDVVAVRLAQMNGLPALRLSAAFQAHHHSTGGDGNPRVNYTAHGDGMHPNRLGGEVAAQALKQVIDGGLPAARRVYTPEDREAVAAARMLGGNLRELQITGPERVFKSLLGQCREEEAVAYLKQLLEEDPNHYFANYGLARFWIARGHTDRAVPLLTRATELQPDNVTNAFLLANAMVSLDRAQEAMAVLDGIIKRTRPTPALHYSIAQSAMAVKDWPAAEQHMNATLELDPQFGDARQQLELIRRTGSGSTGPPPR